MMNKNFQAGAAQVNITPPVGVPQAGYGGRKQGSETVDDELFGKALVLDDGETKAAIITTDLIGLNPEFVAYLRDLVQAHTGIPPENIMACASHTHFGPALKRLEYLPEAAVAGFDRSYVDNLVRLLAGVVHLAHDRRQPAHLGWGVGQAPQLMFNRRTKKADGKVTMSWRMPPPQEAAQLEFGPTDPEIGLLKVEGLDGQLLAALINFACHPVCGVDRMYAISADYPGYAMKVIEQIEGGVCLFALGCAGNIVPIEREGRARKWIGTALGAEALKVLQRISTTDQMQLRVAKATVEIPLRLATEANGKTMATTEIQAIRLGDLILMGLPGEVFVEIGLAIKAWAKQNLSASVFVLSLCNDSLAYVPVASAYDEGGYEPEWTKLGRGSGEKLIQSALSLLQAIQRSI